MKISELRIIIGWFWVAQAKIMYLCTMYVRKKHNRSGSTSVLVMCYIPLILTLLPCQGAVFLPNIHPGRRYALPWADRILGLQPVSPNLYPSINPISDNPPDFITFIRHHIAQWFWVTHRRSQEGTLPGGTALE